MSSKENAQNNACAGESSNHRLNGDCNLPRPPNSSTQSRVLSRILNRSDHNNLNQSHEILDNKESRTNQSGGTGDSGVTPGSDHHSSEALPETSQKTSLSADAKVFIPRQRTLEPYSYCDQDQVITQIDQFNLSDRVREFGPHISEENNYSDNFYQHIPYEEYEEDPSYFIEELNDQLDNLYMYDVPSVSSGNPILDRFNQVIRILSMNPGNMEEYLRPVCDMIRASSDTPEIANDLAESLFNQCIKEANFRYTGARICQFFNSNFKGIPHFLAFKHIFLKKCQNEYKRRNELKAGSPEDQERLRALAMLIAEIFQNVEAETPDGTVERLHFLPGILIDLVQTLLSKPSDLDVKCSCQLLKLAGGLVEDVVKNSPADCAKFEEIFTQLQSLNSNNILTDNTKFIIGTVMKLKDSDWNRSPSPMKGSNVTYSPELSNFQAPETVFYDRCGELCSRPEDGFSDNEDDAYVLNEEEEAAFLSWQKEQDQLSEDQGTLLINDTGYDSYQQGEDDDGEMGDEMEAAYEEFLQKESCLLGYPPQLVGQSPVAIPQAFNHPPPNMPAPQNFNIYQQQHVLTSSQQQRHIPQQYQQLQHDHQQQQQHRQPQQEQQQYHQPQQELQQYRQVQQEQQQYRQPQQEQQQYRQPQQEQQQYQAQYPGNDRYHYHKL